MHTVGSTVKPFIEPMNVTLRSQHTYPGRYKMWSLPSFTPLMLLFKRLKGERLSASVRAAISTFHWNTNEQVQLEAFILHVILIEEWDGKNLKNCPEMCKKYKLQVNITSRAISLQYLCFQNDKVAVTAFALELLGVCSTCPRSSKRKLYCGQCWLFCSLPSFLVHYHGTTGNTPKNFTSLLGSNRDWREAQQSATASSGSLSQWVFTRHSKRQNTGQNFGPAVL